MRPYVYKLENLDGEFYYGVRWDYEGEPENDLLKEYFSSSVTVKKMISENGINYFKGTILKLFETKEQALDYEYTLIKESINNDKCLNRAMGKCTIWNDELKKKVSESVKELWKNPEFRQNYKLKRSAENNHNFGKKPWKNVNSDLESWKKAIIIFKDYQNEKWDLNKYGFGRFFLIKRYGIKQGSARKLVNLLREGWNPYDDLDYLNFIDMPGC
jgi:hypothetical protein